MAKYKVDITGLNTSEIVVLSNEEMTKLFVEYQNGNLDAKDKLINGNLKLGIAIIILWIIMSVVRQLIEPKIVSGKIGIHPIFTIVAMYTGFKLIGVLGMFIGPIVLIILKNVFSSFIDSGLIKTIFDME